MHETTYQWDHRGRSQSQIFKLEKPYGPVNPVLPNQIEGKKPISSEAIANFEQLLRQAIDVRCATILTAAHGEARVAVMYSGGVDCAVIARLIHDSLPLDEPVDLLNVAFENPRTIENAKKMNSSSDDPYDTPDRITGRQGYEELLAVSPRNWRFVEINVSYKDSQLSKGDIVDTMFPNDSVMDLSIAMAFWFCAKGQGTVQGQAYKTPARVYFSGLGADEQLGGYSRHAAAHKLGGYSALIAELQLDLDRLPSRNLGRDDRILSRWAREVRWPFLDENVVAYLSSLPVDQKMDLEQSGGEKLLLRMVGRKLGIPKASAEKKRAIQFGARSARMEIERDKKDRVKGDQKV